MTKYEVIVCLFYGFLKLSDFIFNFNGGWGRVPERIFQVDLFDIGGILVYVGLFQSFFGTDGVC